MQAQPSLDETTDRLERNAMLLGAVPALVVLAVLVWVQPIVAVVVALAVGAGAALWVRSRIASAPARVVAGLDTTTLRPGEHPRLENLLEGLCATSGVNAPTVSLVRSDHMNAMVAAGRDDAQVVMTTAMLEHLGRLELEGVLANLLGRVRDGSARYATTVLGLLGPSSRAQRLLAAELGDQRSVMSDLAAVDLTRYPPGLVSALSTMSERGTHLDVAPELGRSLWLAPVGDSPADADLVGELQPLSLRIAVLSEL
jgi:heat shock protein HtpX